MKKTKRNEQGFSLIETVIVIGMMMTIAGIAIYQSFGSMESYTANSALDVVAGQLRVARQVAISQRRPVQVTITPISADHGLSTISYTTIVTGLGGALNPSNVGGVSPSNTVPLPRETKLMLETGVPDTPMNFGLCGPVCIGNVNGGPPTMYFSPTGQFSQDPSGVTPLNGTIFIGLPNQMGTARAVTIMGSTGRVRPYTYIPDTASTGHWTE
jgi:type II secretory pathway pseudopilin PulG